MRSGTMHGRSRPSTPLLAGLMALVLVLMTVPLSGVSYAATPEYEINGHWVDAPATISRGEPVVGEWRVNLNDAEQPPSNDPVDNVTAEFVTDKAFFADIPDVCSTDAELEPPSNISDDGTVLTCNLGTVEMGTAIVIQTPVVANGETGDWVTLDGTAPDGQQVVLDPIEIRNPFEMDLTWTGASNYRGNWDDLDAPTYVDIDLQWSLRMGEGSDPGPQTVTYRLNVTTEDGSPVVLGTHPTNAGQAHNYGVEGCTEFDLGRADGHPWSHVPTHRMSTNFVDDCTLTAVAGEAGVFDLTLEGIDYDLLNVPELDSVGNLLPPDWDYVASGSLWFRVLTDNAGSIALTSSAPTYTAPTQQTSPDLPGNNTTNKPYTLPGGWSAAYLRSFTGNGGQRWDDTYRVSAGTTVQQYATANFPADNVPANAPYGVCSVLDTAFVEFDPTVPIEYWINPREGGGQQLDEAPGTVEYFTGNTGDPDQFNCGTGTWDQTPPDDPADVTAVRMTFPHSTYSDLDAIGMQFRVPTRIDDDVVIGQDIWMFGSALRNGTWLGPDNPGVVTPTPGLRYPHTNGRRDLLRIILANPNIRKLADAPTVTPGVPAGFTLRYLASGGGSIPDTVDGYEIEDVLPEGMTYLAGSADPEPVTTMSGGQQVLTWTLDAVPTNTWHDLTYQAVPDPSIAPGTTLTNTAVSSLAGQTSSPASATVTTSTNGSTFLGKSPDQPFIPNLDGSGDGTGSWTVSLRSVDPIAQAFTDTIDILPYNGDGRGTSFSGDYTLDEVVVPAGATVYYTDAEPGTLTDDPDDPANGEAGDPTGNTVGWTTTRPDEVTAVRVIGGQLDPGALFSFQIVIQTDGADGEDVWVNRAQSRAEHTALVMRTSAPTVMANHYAANLKKYVQGLDGEWYDANEAAEHPAFELGDDMAYRIVITNVGQGTLTGLEINDDQYPGGSFTVDELGPGEEQVHEFTIEASEEHLGTFVNTACVDAIDTPPDANEPPAIPCDPAGVLVADTQFDKELLGKVANGDGTYTVTYDLTVSRQGDGYPYDLDDELHYGASAEVVSTEVVNTGPGDIDTNASWDGTTDTSVAGGVSIADGETHTYRATVTAAIDDEGTTAAMSDCSMGPDEAGTGFTNVATLRTGQTTFEDEACTEYPAPVITKDVASGPDPVGDGNYEVTYTIQVVNNGVDDTTYDLDDTLRYGTGVSVSATSVANSSPGGIETSPVWDGDSNTRVASAVPLAGEATHTYTATVVFTGSSAVSADSLDCELGAGESGTGLRNEAGLSHNGTVAADDTCVLAAELLPPQEAPAGPAGPEPTGRLPYTGSDLTWLVATGVMALLAGHRLLVGDRRRRRFDTGVIAS